MAAFVAKAVVGNKLNAVKGKMFYYVNFVYFDEALIRTTRKI